MREKKGENEGEERDTPVPEAMQPQPPARQRSKKLDTQEKER